MNLDIKRKWIAVLRRLGRKEPVIGILKPEIKKAWTVELRSGKYQQGYGYLRSTDDQFCCLGVLCDLIAPNDWYQAGYFYRHREHEAVCLPGSIFEYVMSDENTDAKKFSQFIIHLMKMNDTGKSFAEIADWIEEHL